MSDKLLWSLTTYGLGRVAQAISNTGVNLFLQIVKVGDANNTYYTPTESATDLINIKDTFNVLGKNISSSPSGVVFNFLIPESSNGYEIREVGLYEVVDNVEYLFAIGTCQPLLKPLFTDNYAISIDYNIFLVEANLASVYSQIMLNPTSQFATQGQLEQLQVDILNIENNLSSRISINTDIIGKNEPEVINQEINRIRDIIGMSSTYNFITTLANSMQSINNIYSLWFFNFLKDPKLQIVTDFSNLNKNLSLSASVGNLTKNIEGFVDFIGFNSPHNFFLDSSVPFDLKSNGSDSPFTIIFTMSQNNLNNNNNMLLCKTDYNSNNHIFEFKKTSSNSLKVQLFTDSNNNILEESDAGIISNLDPYVFTVTYNGNSQAPSIKMYLNGILISSTFHQTGSYTGMQNIPLPLNSFNTLSGGAQGEYIDSKINCICVLKEVLDDFTIKMLSYNLLSQIGKDTNITT